MLRTLFVFMALTFCFNLLAAEGVLELIPPKSNDPRDEQDSKWTVMTTFGGVRFFKNTQWVEPFKKAIAEGTAVNITLKKQNPDNDDHGRPKQEEEIYLQDIENVTFLDEPAELLKQDPNSYIFDNREIPKKSMISIPQNFTPSNMSSLREAQRVFDSLNMNFNPVIRALGKTIRKEAQCWRKAFVWNYQMDTTYNVKSYKVFLFYSERFYRKYPASRIWDFHVAPIVIVRGIPMVFDPRFFYTPVNLKDWKNEFIDNHAPCKIMHHSSEREREGLQEWCFLRIVPQYYLQ
ncbi:MAG: protein-glutamine glutaminase family protein, partial [Pseudomonadota bacterium]